ncbi:MAG: putative porin [Xanthomonadales bacterium]|nr:putative porin [Xanthomonadales bacterium]
MSAPGTGFGRLRALQVLALAAFSAVAMGQDPFDPLADVEEERRWSWRGDLQVRGEHTSGLPNERADLERLRGRLRFGIEGWLGERLEMAASARLLAGSTGNDRTRVNNDNERSRAFGLDRLVLRWRLGEHTRATLGKDALALTLTPLLWDPDLRPAGLAIDHAVALGDFDRLSLVGGHWAGQHLFGDDSRLSAVQIAWHGREGAPASASVHLALLDFDRLETLTRNGLARTNRVAGGRLVSDYRLLDLLLEGRVRIADRPLRARLDLVRNLGADDLRDGARFDLNLGDATAPGGWELGWAVQRFQRDAVMAAFSDDDWWFHSFARGHALWYTYAFDARWRLRLSGFRETRDGLDRATHRVLLDLESRW